jgi:hypothetical protein
MADIIQPRSEDGAEAQQNGDRTKATDVEQNVRPLTGNALPRAVVDLSAKARDPAISIENGSQNALHSQITVNDSTNRVLAYLVTGAFFGLIVLLMLSSVVMPNVDGGVKDLLFTLLGVVATGWANIIGFYFGSSVGSAQKSQTISSALLHSSPAR